MNKLHDELWLFDPHHNDKIIPVSKDKMKKIKDKIAQM
jgi:hypothetical protein